MTTRNTAERVSELRASYGRSVAHMSDVELLLHHLDMRERDTVNIRDRYMALLTKYGKEHDAAVRQSGVRAVQESVDRYARHAVTQWMGHLVGKLDRDTRALLADKPGKPIGLYDPTPELDALAHVRTVVAVLENRDNLTASDVLRLVKACYEQAGSLRDLFKVGTDRPRQETPLAFAGEHWRDLRDVWAFEPTGTRAHVKAYAVGDAWLLDLWAERGALLAFGAVPEQQVAATAAALISHADEWAADLSTYPWQRFEQARAEAVAL